MTTHWIRCAVALALLPALPGCGDEPRPQPSGRAMSQVEAPADREQNRPPTVDSIRLVPDEPVQGDPLDAKVEASDPDGDGVRLRFQWMVNGRELAGETRPRLRTGDFSKGSKIEVRVVASDGKVESSPAVVRTRIGNRPPRLQGVAFSSNEARTGDPIIASPVVSDPDGDTVRTDYVWYVNGRRSDQRGERFDSSELKRGDRVHVEVVADDGSDETDPVRSAEVVILNSPPRIDGVPSPQKRDDEFVYQFRASDPDGDRLLRYRLKVAPRGMVIDRQTGLARWRPDSSQAGSHPVEVVVEDSYGDGSALRFDVNVEVETSLPAASR